MVINGCQKREHQSASSTSGRNESQNPRSQASGDRLQSTLKEDDDTVNSLSPGVHLVPNLATRVEEDLKKTFGNLDVRTSQSTLQRGVSSHAITSEVVTTIPSETRRR